MHLTGFEPVMSQWEADYESDAFGHLATDAYMELVGFEPTSTITFFDILFLSQKILYCLSFFTTDLKQSNCATKTIITNKSCLAILFLLVILITLSES